MIEVDEADDEEGVLLGATKAREGATREARAMSFIVVVVVYGIESGVRRNRILSRREKKKMEFSVRAGRRSRIRGDVFHQVQPTALSPEAAAFCL